MTAANKWDYTMFGGLPANDTSKSIVENLLSEWWGVTDHESAEETMDWLLGEGHRVSFAEDMEYLAEIGLADAAEDERIDDRREIYEEIKIAPDSPFLPDWGMTLEKGW